MKNALLCMVAVLCFHISLYTQYYFYDATHLEPEWRWEGGITLGWMNCLTDLGGGKGNGKKFIKDINWKNGRPSAGLFLLTTHHDVIALRIEWTKAEVNAADSILKKEESPAALRYTRNLEFKSPISEFNVVAEFHPLMLLTSSFQLLSPYLLLGIGYFHFQPEANYNGTWIRLQPLHTEGQGFKEYPLRTPYKLAQLNFPIGLGIKYDASTFANFRLEILYRILMTDYLDDVSTDYIDASLFYKYFSLANADLARNLADRTKEILPNHQSVPGAIRGNAGNNDGYFSISIKFSIVLNRKRA
jgi:hypothetical protein